MTINHWALVGGISLIPFAFLASAFINLVA